MHVAICVVTFRRPAMLSEMFDGLAALELAEFVGARITVVVVDNDASASARALVDRARTKLPFDVNYVVEPQRGIAHARNKAVAEALARGAEYLAMIDDDEVPYVDWLSQLLRTQHRYSADALYGPVRSRFAGAPPQWIIDGHFFDRPIIPTGDPVSIGATGNVLLTRRLLESHVPPFDTRFGLTGGEDTHFFLRLRHERIAVISCAEAVVVETVPAARTTLRYLLRRAYAGGSSYVTAERCFDGGPIWAFRRTFIAILRVVEGLATAVFSWPFGKHRAVRGLQKVALGAGMLASMRGVRFDSYQTIEGA